MENGKITLKELKARLPSTAGKKLPSPRHLRENDTLVVRAKVLDSVMEVYSSGFAIYRTPGHFAMIRMDCVGKTVYESEQTDWHNTVKVLDKEWTIGVMLSGEERMERQYKDKAEDSLVSLTGANPDESGEDMEIDAGIDVMAEIISNDVMTQFIQRLTTNQREVFRLIFVEGLTNREAAELLGCSKQSVNETISWLKKKFQKNF